MTYIDLDEAADKLGITPNELERRIRQGIKADHDCADCGADTSAMGEYYMVDDRIWAEAGNVEGLLCIGCLEHRLGRRLRPSDFTNAPVNRWPEGYSTRLEDRLGGRARDHSAKRLKIKLEIVEETP